MRERELLKLAQERAIAVFANAENTFPLLRWIGLGCGKGTINNTMK